MRENERNQTDYGRFNQYFFFFLSHEYQMAGAILVLFCAVCKYDTMIPFNQTIQIHRYIVLYVYMPIV